MRILVFLPSVGYGGAERIAIQSAKEYAAAGHEVYLGFDHQEKNRGIVDDVRHSSLKVLNSSIATLNYFGNNKLNNLWIIFHAVKAIKRSKPDVVVLHLPYFNVGHQLAYAVLKRNKKLVIVFHSASAVFQPNSVYAGLVKRYLNERLFLVSVSEDNRLNIAKSFGLQSGQINMIYNGIYWSGQVSRHVGEKRPVLRSYGIDERHFVFVTIGRLDIHKGFMEAIYAASKLVKKAPDVRFLWIGEGPQRKDFEDEVRRRGLGEHIIFGGASDRVYDILDASDVFLFPTHFEGLSLALLEAVSRKIPVIASNANSNVEVIVNGDTGLTFPIFDSCDLLEKMEWALDNQVRMQEMAEKAFCRSKELFDMGAMVSTQLKLFSSLLT